MITLVRVVYLYHANLPCVGNVAAGLYTVQMACIHRNCAIDASCIFTRAAIYGPLLWSKLSSILK